MAGFPMSPGSVRGQIASAIKLIIQLQRLSDGSRRVTHISEITGMEGDVIQMQALFEYHRTGVGPDGKVLGDLRSTGMRPQILEHLRVCGIDLPSSYFDPKHA